MFIYFSVLLVLVSQRHERKVDLVFYFQPHVDLCIKLIISKKTPIQMWPKTEKQCGTNCRHGHKYYYLWQLWRFNIWFFKKQISHKYLNKQSIDIYCLIYQDTLTSCNLQPWAQNVIPLSASRDLHCLGSRHPLCASMATIFTASCSTDSVYTCSSKFLL